MKATKGPENGEDLKIKELEQETRKLIKENDDLMDTINVLKKSIVIFV